MILQLQPEQVDNFWPAIRQMAIQSGRVTGGDIQKQLNTMLQSILLGKYQCWVAFTRNGGVDELHSVGLTCVSLDGLTGVSQLVVDAVFAYRPFTEELLFECAEAIKAFARASNCTHVRTQTNNPRAEKLLLDAGFASTQRIYLLEVKP